MGEINLKPILDKMDQIGSEGWNQQSDVAVSITAINTGETNVFNLSATDCTYIINNLTLKFVDPGANTITVRLYGLVNDVLTELKSFAVTTLNYTTYFSLIDMFGVGYISGDNIKVTIRASAGGPYACTGQYQYGLTTLIPTQTLVITTDFVPRGYYAETYLHHIDADLAVGNIKTGVNIFGFVGTYDTEAGQPIVAGRLRTGDIGFVNGAKITGTGTKTLTDANDTVAAGYYAATTLSAVDTDLAVGNILAGKTIFGFAGTATNSGDAVAGNMLTGKKAWVAGTEITGNVPAGANVNGANGVLAITITNGLYSGSKTCTAADTSLVTANIKSGATIFGVGGTATVVDVSVGTTAAAGNVKSTVWFYTAAGVLTQGTLP